jgi:hypothetical protein
MVWEEKHIDIDRHRLFISEKSVQCIVMLQYQYRLYYGQDYGAQQAKTIFSRLAI